MAVAGILYEEYATHIVVVQTSLSIFYITVHGPEYH